MDVYGLELNVYMNYVLMAFHFPLTMDRHNELKKVHREISA